MATILHRLFMSRPKKPILRIAFWTERELSDLCSELAGVLEADALARDYENEWEWLEGFSRRGFSVNVSRTHDWSKGDYDRAVLVDLTRDGTRLDIAELRSWASAIAEHMRCDVSIGEVSHGEGRSYELLARETIHGKKEG